MCEQHRHLASTAVAERRPVSPAITHTPAAPKAISASPEDTERAAGDAVSNLIMTFGYEAVQKAIAAKKPKPEK